MLVISKESAIIGTLMKFRFTPSNITKLGPNEVFVFGSNLAGVHGAGAARDAFNRFDAKWGVGEGPTGRCYAIPTKDANIESRHLSDIGASISLFIKYASQRPDEIFLVTEIGCGFAGFKHKEIAQYFRYDCTPNIILPEIFVYYAIYNGKEIK